MLENAINNFSVDHDTSTTTSHDDHITDSIDIYLCDDAYKSDIDIDEENWMCTLYADIDVSVFSLCISLTIL